LKSHLRLRLMVALLVHRWEEAIPSIRPSIGPQITPISRL